MAGPWKTWPGPPASGREPSTGASRPASTCSRRSCKTGWTSSTHPRGALDVPDAWRALGEWLELHDRCAAEYRGMSARVGESLTDDSSAVGTLCGPMRNSFGRLFERARQEVPLRPDLTPTQLLSMVSVLPKDAGTGRTLEPCMRVVLDGLRA